MPPKRAAPKSIRPVGLRFSPFAFMTEVSAGNARGIGFGEAPTQLVALQKSIAEGVERAIYRALKGTSYGSSNSNGWAAHISRERAFDSAIEELVERDAVLVHWLRQVPMVEIMPSTWPMWLNSWIRDELRLATRFNKMRVLISSQGFLPTVTTVLLDQAGHAVLSHATARSLEHALPKALAETCRIAQIAMEGAHIESSARLTVTNDTQAPISPEDHAMFYAFHERLPQWIFGERVDWNSTRSGWKKDYKNFDRATLNPKFHQIADGPLVVGYATSELIQGLYFGRTQDAQERGIINVRRLSEVNHEGKINLLPHCVA